MYTILSLFQWIVVVHLVYDNEKSTIHVMVLFFHICLFRCNVCNAYKQTEKMWHCFQDAFAKYADRKMQLFKHV